MKEYLYNKKSIEELRADLKKENFKRVTYSFYNYVAIDQPDKFRDRLYKLCSKNNVLGRIYIANEGINAQLSIPESNWTIFKNSLSRFKNLKKLQFKKAIEDGNSFLKLIVKVKKEIVAYNVDDNDVDMQVVGKHLSPQDFNEKIDQHNAVVVDMRNYYESEVGRFESAITPNVATSRELLSEVKELIKSHKKDPVLLYCTGGIRCEKASSYLIQNGFEDVYQLSGGIINYAHEVRSKKIKSKFKGKNFVFDARMGERVTSDVIGNCYQCGMRSDDHKDCNNDACNVLFIQCKKCNKEFLGCCSKDCMNFSKLSDDKQKQFRKDPDKVVYKKRYSMRALNSN